jgi:hypothetical protein
MVNLLGSRLEVIGLKVSPFSFSVGQTTRLRSRRRWVGSEGKPPSSSRSLFEYILPEKTYALRL